MESFRKVVENHLQHDADLREEEIKSRIKLAQALDKLNIRINGNG